MIQYSPFKNLSTGTGNSTGSVLSLSSQAVFSSTVLLSNGRIELLYSSGVHICWAFWVSDF
jgi:hypothetical protein